jgi:hypothetical protein
MEVPELRPRFDSGLATPEIEAGRSPVAPGSEGRRSPPPATPVRASTDLRRMFRSGLAGCYVKGLPRWSDFGLR